MLTIGTKFVYLGEKGYEGIVFAIYSNYASNISISIETSRDTKMYGVVIYEVSTKSCRFEIIKEDMIKPILTFNTCIDSINVLKDFSNKLKIWKKGDLYKTKSICSYKSVYYDITITKTETIVSLTYKQQTQHKYDRNRLKFTELETTTLDIEKKMTSFQKENSKHMSVDKQDTPSLHYNVGDIFEMGPHIKEGTKYRSSQSWRKYKKYNRDDIINMNTPKKFGIVTQIYSIQTDDKEHYRYAIAPYLGIDDEDNIKIKIGSKSSCNFFEDCKYEGEKPINVFEIINLFYPSQNNYSFKTPICNDIYMDDHYTELYEKHKFCQQYHIKYDYSCKTKSCMKMVSSKNNYCKKCHPKKIELKKNCSIEKCVGPYLFIDKYVKTRHIKNLKSNIVVSYTQYMYGEPNNISFIETPIFV
jgi:hypothetical protein